MQNAHVANNYKSIAGLLLTWLPNLFQWALIQSETQFVLSVMNGQTTIMQFINSMNLNIQLSEANWGLTYVTPVIANYNEMQILPDVSIL